MFDYINISCILLITFSPHKLISNTRVLAYRHGIYLFFFVYRLVYGYENLCRQLAVIVEHFDIIICFITTVHRCDYN